MRGSKVAKTVIIVVVLAAIVLVYYYYLGHREKRQEVEQAVAASEVQSVLMRDLEHNYPPTPKEVVLRCWRIKSSSSMTQSWWRTRPRSSI